MAQILLEYYKFVGEKKGYGGRVRLAQMTKISSSEAAFKPDDPANIDLFKNAIKEITGEFPPQFLP
jgi:hypothetical protein